MAHSGHGATIAFGTTSGFTPAITRVSAISRSRGAIDVTNHATTNQKEWIPEDLWDVDELVVDYQYDQSAATYAPIAGASETITLTWGLKTGETAGATFAGTGFLTNESSGDQVAASTDPIIGSVTIKYDGQTEAAYAAGS